MSSAERFDSWHAARRRLYRVIAPATVLLALLLAATAAAAAETRTIVAFGDSLTAGLGVARTGSYPSQLQERLQREGYGYRVVNAGVSGDTTAGGLRRVDAVLQLRPEIVIVEFGANDGLRGVPLVAMRENLEQIVARLRAGGAQVVLAGMKLPPNYGPAYTGGFEAVYRELAQRQRVRLLPFFLAGVAAKADLNQDDGLHPTADGYRIVVDNLWPVLKPLLRR